MSTVGEYGITVGGAGGVSLRGQWQSCVILDSEGGVESIVPNASPTVGNSQGIILSSVQACFERNSLSVLSVK